MTSSHEAHVLERVCFPMPSHRFEHSPHSLQLDQSVESSAKARFTIDAAAAGKNKNLQNRTCLQKWSINPPASMDDRLVQIKPNQIKFYLKSVMYIWKKRKLARSYLPDYIL